MPGALSMRRASFDIVISAAIRSRWESLPGSVRRELERQLRLASELIALRSYLEDRYGRVATVGFEAEYAIDASGRKLEVFDLELTE